jgi:phage baseplate assembly protein W
MILGTRLGERPMNRNFGTQLREMVHEPNDGGLASLLARQVRDALVQMEPRIAVADISFRGEGASLTLDLTYLPADRTKTETLLIPLG